MHMRMLFFQGGSIGPPFKWYDALPRKECRGIAICGILLLFPPFALSGRIVELRSVSNQVVCSIVPCKGPGWVHLVEVL